MNNETEKILVLLNNAIAICKQIILDGETTGNAFHKGNGKRSIAWLEEIKSNILEFRLPPASGSTLGLSRDFSEWAPDNLYEIGNEIDRLYLERG